LIAFLPHGIHNWDGPQRDSLDNPVLSATPSGRNLAAAGKAGVKALFALWEGLPDSARAAGNARWRRTRRSATTVTQGTGAPQTTQVSFVCPGHGSETGVIGVAVVAFRAGWPAGCFTSAPWDAGAAGNPRCSRTHSQAYRTKGDRPSPTWHSRCWLHHTHPDLSDAPPEAVSTEVAAVLGSPATERHPINIPQPIRSGAVDGPAGLLRDLTGFDGGPR
jgi:hypothetical protein